MYVCVSACVCVLIFKIGKILSVLLLDVECHMRHYSLYLSFLYKLIFTFVVFKYVLYYDLTWVVVESFRVNVNNRIPSVPQHYHALFLSKFDNLFSQKWDQLYNCISLELNKSRISFHRWNWCTAKLIKKCFSKTRIFDEQFSQHQWCPSYIRVWLK